MKKLIIIILGLLIGFVCFVQADYEQTIVATTLILEAGGEYDEGSLEAVYEVIHNRAIKRDKTYEEVCLQYKQFSCWNNIHSPFRLDEIDKNVRKAKRHPRWAEAMKIASSESNTNYTKGADHYHADYVSPYWKDLMTKTVKIGRHIFYKESR
jgi:spore germination cell wall hydrolase CwlJ-like protein